LIPTESIKLEKQNVGKRSLKIKLGGSFDKYSYERKKIKTEYEKYLRNNRVMIVGSSSHLVGKRKKNFIESFDIVVRLNNGYRISPSLQKDVGFRTDILCSSLSDLPPKKYAGLGKFFDFELLSRKIKWMCATAPEKKIRIENFKNRYLKGLFPLYVIDATRYKFLVSITKRRLTTGFSAISDLLSYRIKELYIIGFTFFFEREKSK